MMEIWLDTVDPAAIKHAQDLGLLYGVTTNPSIVSKASKPLEDVLEEILMLFPGPVAVQVTLMAAHEMIEQAKDLIDFSERIIVKIPATPQGIEAISHLSSMDIPTMATAIFEPLQGFFAAQAGALYLAPYFGHIEKTPLEVCLALQQICDVQDLPSKLIVAALRSKEQVIDCLLSGFDALTLPPSLFAELLDTPYEVRKHLDKFQSDWKKAPPSNLLAPRALYS